MTLQVFQGVDQRGHEQVVYFNYPEVGLKAIVAIHNSVRGPALGGCRMRLYADEAQALEDALRLSEGMTYKNALAELPIGGGKSVMIADPQMKEGREKLFEQFGRCLNYLAGRYITAEDMGTSVQDVASMRKHSKYAAGFSREEGGGGDPSPWTARGVFAGIQAAAEVRYGTKDLTGKVIALQGVGHVGMFLLEHLTKAGAKCVVADTRADLVREAAERFGAEVVQPGAIYDVKSQIFSPNAIGQTVNHETLARLSCDIIAGGANNQLTDSSVYQVIEKKGMIYCPDFVINAGGVCSVAAEYNDGGWKEAWVAGKADNIGNTVRKVLSESKAQGLFPEVVAIKMAKELIKA